MRTLIIISFFIGLFACNNLLDADLSTRQSFIKSYGAAGDIEAVALALAPDGYILLGNMPDPDLVKVTRDSIITVVMKTDFQGKLITRSFIRNGRGNDILVIPEGSNYSVIVVGETNPEISGMTHSRMIKLDANLQKQLDLVRSDPNNVIRFRAISANHTTDNKLVILGTYRNATGLDKPYLETRNLDLSVEWFQDFPLDASDKAYRNAHAVHYRNGSIIWASAISRQQVNSEVAWLSIPVAANNSTFDNAAVLGENANLSIRPADIQPAFLPEFGFGVVGTRANQNGTESNIFFVRTDRLGNIIPNTLKYYDAITITAQGAMTDDALNDDIQDFGAAITATQDGGFVLAGHFESIPGKGNGLQDIFLIKIDMFGNVLWSNTIGGTGGETVIAIRETEDQGLMIFGTNTVQGVSSIFLIKTDKNGELTK
jgi:hypothetical protein